MATHLLFSYGTLRLPAVQQALLGRELTGEADAMLGWSMGMIEISAPDVIAKSATRFYPLGEPSDDATAAVESMVSRNRRGPRHGRWPRRLMRHCDTSSRFIAG